MCALFIIVDVRRVGSEIELPGFSAVGPAIVQPRGVENARVASTGPFIIA